MFRTAIVAALLVVPAAAVAQRVPVAATAGAMRARSRTAA
jgi:hypothetical protein